MGKGFYIHTCSKTEYGGVEKKISNQLKVFADRFEMHEVIVDKEDTNIIKSIAWRLPGGSWGARYQESLDKIKSISRDDVTFFYIRFTPIDRRYIDFLLTLKELYPNAKFIMEMPAFPYYNEYLHSLTMWPWYFKDRFHNSNLKKVVNRMVTYSSHDTIYGVSTIKTMNGFIVDDVAYNKSVVDDCVDLIAVASMQKHHGYERIIKGIKSYYDNGGVRKIKLHLVGQGDQCSFYKKLTEDLDVSDNVLFWGNRNGEELERLYGMADIGLGSLAFHSIGAQKTISSTLKTREYLAHGIPFVSACVEDVFLKNPESEYYRKYPDDETTIPIADVIDFYDELIGKHSNSEELLRKSIHDFAKKTIDMQAVMEPVIDYIEKGCIDR